MNATDGDLQIVATSVTNIVMNDLTGCNQYINGCDADFNSVDVRVTGLK